MISIKHAPGVCCPDHPCDRCEREGKCPDCGHKYKDCVHGGKKSK